MGIVYRNDHSYCGPISMLKRLENGDIVLVFREALWRGFHTHCDPTTRTSLLRLTDPDGAWHTQVTPDPAGGNGTAVNQLSDGTLIVNNFRWVCVPLSQREKLQGLGGYMELQNLGLAAACEGVFTARSSNGGYTWGPLRRVETPGFEMSSTAGRIVELEDGSLLIPLNGKKPDEASGRCWVARSSDGGDTWEYLATVARAEAERGFHELRILPLPGGRILAMMRTPDAGFYRSHSDDGGQTWSALEETPMWCGGSSPADLLLLRDGRVLCTYGHRRPPFGVRTCLSEDGGSTWDIRNEIVLRDDAPDRDVGYPSSEQLEDGSILTVYYWHGEDPVRHLVGTRWDLDM